MALAISIRTLSICTTRTANSWVRYTGAAGGNSRFNMTDSHYAAPAHLWSRSANTPDIVWPAVESVQLTAAGTSSENGDGSEEALSVLKWPVHLIT